MSTQKKTKVPVVAELQAKLADYAKTIEAQRARLVEMSKRLEDRDADIAAMRAADDHEQNGELDAKDQRIEGLLDTLADIRRVCVRGGVVDAEAMPTLRAVERLAARVGDFQRIERERSNAVMHRQTMQDVLESVGYTVEYGNNGTWLSIQRKQSEVVKVKTPWWHLALDITGYVLISIALCVLAYIIFAH